MAEAGLDPEPFLGDPQYTPAIAGLVARLLGEAEMLYNRSRAGIPRLPLDCRIGIAAARRIYSGIGDKLAQARHDSITRRARVSGREKLSLALRGMADMFAWSASAQPALAANQFLVTSAASEPVIESSGVTKLLLLFERLERNQREAAERITA
jgi:phytoene synthase